eukprot:CAMPEP_0206251272 /NCGR_PEP_ID=MMETSP0047_2-20121206/21932_1 /ASSEMBLY_ACC=CAM_ASM_000192 /TAXON_ID=195065 /ORGANISM="Chroomonas mesostigmatica_cf, Strain CCMP1168" /LENGTH=50 /DNA_ID=CAMNT_0053677207 /DNA_START=226 /DNA_END=378 /DNA_ORIENTATION=-
MASVLKLGVRSRWGAAILGDATAALLIILLGDKMLAADAPPDSTLAWMLF